MRRLSVLITVLAMFMAMPLVANAQETFEVDIHTSGSQVRQTADGCNITTGEFYVEFDGVVVETGTTRLITCPNRDGSRVTYQALYRDDATGNEVRTAGVAVLTAADPGAGVFTYALREWIVSSTTGIAGRATGTAEVVLTGTGFDVTGWNHWTIRG